MRSEILTHRLAGALERDRAGQWVGGSVAACYGGRQAGGAHERRALIYEACL